MLKELLVDNLSHAIDLYMVPLINSNATRAALVLSLAWGLSFCYPTNILLLLSHVNHRMTLGCLERVLTRRHGDLLTIHHKICGSLVKVAEEEPLPIKFRDYMHLLLALNDVSDTTLSRATRKSTGSRLIRLAHGVAKSGSSFSSYEYFLSDFLPSILRLPVTLKIILCGIHKASFIFPCFN